MLDAVRGTISMRVICSDTAALLNEARKQGIVCRDISHTDGGFDCILLRRDYECFLDICEDMGAECDIIGTAGLFPYLTRYRHRTGILAGFVLAAALVLFMYNTVLKIEIYGCETIPEEKITELLYENGITYGCFIPSLDFQQTAARILSGRKDIAWITIRHSGCRVCVELKEMTVSPKIERRYGPSNIIARYDAQITEVTVHSGMLVPMVGEGVKKGSVIVSGVIPDKFGKTILTRSMGSVKGIYKDKITLTQPLIFNKRVPSGRTLTRRSILFWGRRVPLFSGEVDGDCTVISDTKYLSALTMTFPVGVETEEYVFYDTVEQTVTEDEAYIILEQQLESYESNLLSSVTVLSRETSRTASADAVAITALYTLEGEIGVQSDIFAK